MQRAISVFDLLNCETSRQVLHSGNELAFTAMMHNLGFDMNHGVEREECLHRPLHSNEAVFGTRWVGRERTDEKWLKGEVCTYDNKLERIGVVDVEFQRDLLKMCTVPSIMERMISEMSEYHSSGTESLE